MKIAVCFKQVPDSSTRVRIGSDGRQIAEDGVSFVINPYDEFAIAKARELADSAGGTVTMITVGPDRVTPDIRKAMAQGGDDAVHLKTDDVSDSFGVAKVLAEEIKAGGYGLVLMGKQAIDDDLSQTGQLLGELLGWGVVTVATEMSVDGDKLKVTREVIGGSEVYSVALPAVVTAQKGLAEAVYPSLKALMQAKKKPVEIKEVSLDAPVLETVKLELPPEKGAGKILANGADDVPQLLDLLRNEAKVIG